MTSSRGNAPPLVTTHFRAQDDGETHDGVSRLNEASLNGHNKFRWSNFMTESDGVLKSKVACF